MTLEKFLNGQPALKQLVTPFPKPVFKPLTQVKRKLPASGEKKAKEYYSADFETTTDENDCRVWAWGLSNIKWPSYEDVEIGNNIDSFMERIQKHNSGCYFHNLRFDGSFIIDWLLNNGFKHVQTDTIKRVGNFKTLISDMGKFYSITVKWNNGNTTEFRDSLKKLPMSVAKVAKAFKLGESKGELDYEAFRPIGHELTSDEEDYLRKDVSIIAQAMKEVHENGMTRLTVASDSLSEYKKLIGIDIFKRLFPVFSESMDAEIRRAYRGGWTYLDPRYKGFITGSGIVLDVNSLYPSVMMNNILPYGEPQYVDGFVEPTESRPLTIFSVTFTAKLKRNHVPCIQIKGSSIFHGTEYLKEIKDPVTLMVTNIDWALYNDQYDIQVLAYGGGWRFKALRGLFDSYITKWGKIKEMATGGQKEIAKLHLNSLYGKFASNPNVTSKIPRLEENKNGELVVKLIRGENDTRPPVYTAVGVFITSFARDLTIRAAQDNYKYFAYADTDSLHLLMDEVPKNIDIHPTKMGAWKLEYHFEHAFYIRAKAYVEQKETIPYIEGKFITHIAGLPEKVTENITFDDLVDGKVFHGKLNPKTVPGGVVLKDIPFQLKL